MGNCPELYSVAKEKQKHPLRSGKIHALRFFTISAMVLSLASALSLTFTFLPFVGDKPVEMFLPSCIRGKLLKCGENFAIVAGFYNLLGTTIAASVDMQEGYTLNGAGFVFLVLGVFVDFLGRVLASYTKASSSSSPTDVKASKPEQ